MNIRIVDGRLTRDAEVKTNKANGAKFLTFTIANNSYANEQEITTYFNVISYNEHDILKCDKFTKGKLLVVTGRPNESMTVKDGKTYLNRSIMAHSIESGTFNSNRENTSQGTTYRDVAPATPDVQMPTREVPRPVMPSITTPPITNATPQQRDIAINNENPSGGYEFVTQMPQTSPASYVDDLPF